ncbi:MAG: hypothetical protein ACTIH2_02145 [Anaerococcus sp.]
MKLQIKYTFMDQETQKEVNRSKTFSNINLDATDENFIAFAKAYMSLSDIINFTVLKITTEEIQEA